MTTVDRFHELLVQSAQGRSRVDQELLWRALHAVHPEISVTTSARTKLNDLIQQLVQQSLIELPRGRDCWDRSSAPQIPTWVRLCSPSRQRKTRDLRNIPWATELRFLASARTDLDMNDLLHFQNFFAQGGRDLPVVPIKERSLQVFGDEKRLDNLYSSSAIFAMGRLTLEQLRCTVVAEPLGWKRGPATAGPIIVIENVATWHSFCRWNEVVREFSAVVYGGGNRFMDSFMFLRDVMSEIGGEREVVYFGDLDAAGLHIPQCASHRAIECGLACLRPHRLSYEWLLQSGTPVDDPNACPDRHLCDWLGDLREAAWSVLSSGKRIPQERLGWEFLQHRTGAHQISRGHSTTE